MKSGYSLTELMVYIVLLAIFFSILTIVLWKFSEKMMFMLDVKNVEHLIKYARQISLLKKVKSVFYLRNGEMYVKVGSRILKRRKVEVAKFKSKVFAFSNGIPVSPSGSSKQGGGGEFFLSIKDEKVRVSIQPVTGFLKIVWK